jgi:GntR family transcriptional regulator, arabinose operon transcriptional repressor
MPRTDIPKFQRIFDELRGEIVSGKLKPGDRFPSEAALVRRFDASRITVGRAVRDLRELGLVQRRAGSGTYVQAHSSGTSSGFSFGLLIPDLGQTEIFEPICQGMADAAQAGEHALLWSSTVARDEAGTRQDHALKLCRQYIARKVSGVFFAPFETLGADDLTNTRIVEAFDEARIPVVLLDRDFLPYPRRSHHDLVGIDNRRTGFAATEHLLALGSRRIAFLSYPGTASTVDERVAGYREALFMRRLPVDPALVLHLHKDEETTLRKAVEKLQPDAFVCANDRTAGRLMHSLLAMGRRIPGDIRIVGIDDIAYAALLPVPLTTIHQPCREIGISAMSAMLERIQHPTAPARDILLHCPLIIRRSCGASIRNESFRPERSEAEEAGATYSAPSNKPALPSSTENAKRS